MALKHQRQYRQESRTLPEERERELDTFACKPSALYIPWCVCVLLVSCSTSRRFMPQYRGASHDYFFIDGFEPMYTD